MKEQNKYYLLTIFENTSDLYNGFEEMLRERVYHYKKSLTPLDFWVIKNIKFDIEELNKQKNENEFLKGFTIITTNKIFFEWIKLRYGYFENMSNNLTLSILENIKNSTYTVDGFYLNLKQIPYLKRKTNLFKE